MRTPPIRRRSIEYSVVDHCNLACYGCDHSSPVLPAMFASVPAFEGDLRALRGVLQVRTLYLIGGEPLLHPRLLELVIAASHSEIADGVTLVTNGTLLHTMPDEVWRQIAGIDLTLYPGVTLRASLDDLARRARDYHVSLRVRRRDEFRHTVLNDRIDDDALVQRVFDACRIAHDYGCHAIHRGRYYKCSVAPHLPKRLRQRGQEDADWEADGVALHNNPRLRRDLERYLSDDRPLAACRYCLGTSGTIIPHHQMNATARRRWLLERHDDPAALIDRTKLVPIRGTAQAPAVGAWNGYVLRSVDLIRRYVHWTRPASRTPENPAAHDLERSIND